jgi:competence protein ComK
MKYEVSKGTLAIVPNEKNTSLVLEDEERYIVNNNPFEIMEESCKYFGSTYQARKQAAKEILGAEYKVPILVDELNNIIALPTTSPLSVDCIWLSLTRIKKIERVSDFVTKVIFDNDLVLNVPCSYRSVESQISRAYRLEFLTRKRREFLSKNS